MELEKMFERQKELQKVAVQKELPNDMPNEFYLHATSCIVELSEAIQEDNRWKVMMGGKKAPKFNNEAKLEELVDAMHFLINAVLYSGFDYKDFIKVFEEKNNKNYYRLQGIFNSESEVKNG